MKSYFKPLLLIGDEGPGDLIPPDQVGSLINTGGGDNETTEEGNRSVLEVVSTDAEFNSAEVFTAPEE